MSNPTTESTIWTRSTADGGAETNSVLVGRRISPEWLQQSLPLTEIRLSGDFYDAMADVLEKAKGSKMNLPIASLRTALTAGVDNVISLDRDLGLNRQSRQALPAAMVIYRPAADDRSLIEANVRKYVKRWLKDEVEQWAERHSIGEMAARATKLVDKANILFSDVDTPLLRPNGQPEYALIARAIGQRLIGEELFEGLGACELVASPEMRSNYIELMTLPVSCNRGDSVFSMVARITVASMPYSHDVYVGISTMKRVWAKQVPKVSMHMPMRVTGYVMAEGRPALMVTVERRNDAWQFGENYLAARVESDGLLPETLQDAVEQREFDHAKGWWAGLPELPTLFRSLAQRSAFEADEILLLQTISKLLGSMLTPDTIPIRESSRIKSPKKSQQEMLKTEDLWGAAGDSLVSEAIVDEMEDAEENEQDAMAGLSRKEKLQRYRIQNQKALDVMGGLRPQFIKLYGGTPDEVNIIRSAVRALFGDQLQLIEESLPDKTHGLRVHLEGASLKARERFDLRVKGWGRAANDIKERAGGNPAIAMICAPERIGSKMEDPVNYYAGIHAFSNAGANVHHVLPIENPGNPKSQQSFLHRVQSAILDVVMAHSGLVFGTKRFFESLLPPEAIPYAVYGIQVIRSRARTRSGEQNVTFILYTRLVIETGMTEIQIVYKEGRKTERTAWMPLNRGLQWIGSNRRLHEGDDIWLKDTFKDETRETLLSIHNEDPRAIVMIDWQSVASLWNGIRDEDLRPGRIPMLDNISLSAFPTMSFVRLRRGSDTLALRTASRKAYEGWKEGEAQSISGEIYVDEYYTTSKSLVEVTEEGSRTHNYGHYIATMGYAKTVQIKRGFSCYHPTSRIQRIGKGMSEFKLISLEPADFDAALPAPMDVTVMQAPANVSTELIAMVVMGLRLGYAHYNDWTTLPAPLFFRRKIEDYIIRFPEDEDISVSAISDEPLETNTQATQLELLLQEEDLLEPLAAVPEAVPEVLPSLTENEEIQPMMQDEVEGDPCPEYMPEKEDILLRAQGANMPVLASINDLAVKRLYKRMMQDKPGEVVVHVNLPSFVHKKGLFGQYSNLVRRNSSRIWRAMIEFEYVGSRVSKPKDADLLDRLAERLIVPQSLVGLSTVTASIGGISLEPFCSMVEKLYNVHRPEDDRINPRRLTIEDGETLLAWADANKSDTLVAWILFLWTQYPPREGLQGALGLITKIHGAWTEEALHYYLNCCSALEAALEQKDRLGNFQAVVRYHKQSDIPQRNDAEAIIESDLEARPEVHLLVTPPTDIPKGRVMEIKEDITRYIQQLDIGSDRFVTDIENVDLLIEELKVLHQEAVERGKQNEELKERLSALRAAYDDILEKLNKLCSVLDICYHHYEVPQDEEALQLSESAAVDLNRFITDIHGLNDELNSLPTHSPSVKERLRIGTRTAEISNSIIQLTTDLVELLGHTPCIRPDGEPSPEPDDKQPVPDTEIAIPEPQAVAPEPVPEVNILPTGQVPSELVDFMNTPAAPAIADKVTAEITQETIDEVSNLEPAPFRKSENQAQAEDITPTKGIVQYENAARAVTGPAVELEMEVVLGGAFTDEAEFLKDLEGDIDVLHKVMEKRYYGLAEVTVAALKHILDKSENRELRRHHSILKSLVSSLYSMDCQFDFNIRMDSELLTDLSENGIDSCASCDATHAAIGVLAAALPGMLFDSSGSQWGIGNEIQTRVMGYSAVAKLVGHINDMRTRGIPVSPHMFRASHVGEKQAIESEIQRIQKRASEWKDTELFNGWKHRGYQRMHEEIYGNRSQVGQCLSMIERGEGEKLKTFYPEVRSKIDRPSQYIDNVFRRIDRGRPDGPYRERAIENLERTRDLVDSFLDCHVRLKNPVSKDEIGQNYRDFVQRLHDLMLEAVREIINMKPRTSLERFYSDSAKRAIECAIRLYSDTAPPFCIPQDKQKLLLQLAMDQSLVPNIEPIDAQTPPLHSPAEVIKEVSHWGEDNLYVDESTLQNALLDAMKSHIQAKRFLPAFRINQMLPKAMTQDLGLQVNYNREREDFKDELQVVSQRVTHALSLDAVQTEKAHRMQWFIGEMQNALREERTIGGLDNTLATYPDFLQARAALKRNVNTPLADDLYKAREDLRNNLERLEQERGTEFRDDIRRVREILKDDNAAALRTAHDAWMMLNQGQHLPERMDSQTDFGGLYDTFIHDIMAATANRPLLPSICELLRAEPSDNDLPYMAHMDREQREESARMIETWQEVFKHQNLHVENSPLMQLFHQMGFTHDLWFANDVGRRRLQFNLDSKSFVFLSRDDDNMFIPPALGSRATHIQGIVVEGHPNENNIAKLIPEINGTPTLILAHMRGMDMAARARVCRSTTAILLDDYLICYIAMHPGRNIQTLMSVAVLTYATNPYDDYNGTPVPQEMFFGRRTELQRINEIKSSGILFGGRRLGKSSLLAQIETEMRGKRGNIAIYISMDTIDLENHVVSAWTFVYNHLVERGVIKPSITINMKKAAEIQEWLNRELSSNKELKQLFLLIDEADRLMGRELKLASGDVGFVRGMQQMIDNLRHTMQLRYVIAGLHNTARMASDENSVFGKVDSIALEPFNTRDDIQRGIRLITKPLAAMGYLFRPDGQDLPLRILSVCNFYPAFIQLYCRELVIRLQNRQQSNKPPIFIETRDLDHVENDSGLLTTLRTKFGYNLDLDKRYRAIALILADVYYSEVGSGNNDGLTSSQIREHCETFAGNHFKDTGIGVYEALLDEMCKLNILDHNGTRYVLRNPGIAMMMGNQESITAQLSDLGKLAPEDNRNQGDNHIRLRLDGKVVSPIFPYPAGWVRRQLQTDDGELLIATGNKASGIYTLTELGREEWKIGNHGIICNMPGSGPMAANDVISKRRRGHSQMPKIMALRQHTWHIRQLEEFAAIAAKARKTGVRIALIASPEESLEIARMMDSGQLPREGSGWSIVPIPPWTADSVFFGLSENIKVAEDPAAIQSILDATCGFGMDIDRLCNKHLTRDDAMNEMKRVRDDYGASLQAFYNHIGLPVTFDAERRDAIHQLLPAIDGLKRNSSDVNDWLNAFGVTHGEFEFLYWMGLVQDGDNATWKIPKLYLDLMNRK